MSALLRTPPGRMMLALTVSILIHLALLFTPVIELAPTDPPLPPLQAKLEPLPKIAPPPPRAAKAKKTPARPAPKTEQTPPPQPVATEPEALPETAPAPVEDDKAAAPAVPEKIEEAPPAHPLPRHAELAFAVMHGTEFKVGEARQRFDIGPDGRYTLKVGVNTTGIVSLLKKFDLNQVSSGTVGPRGLQPDEFREVKNNSSNIETRIARFDWQAQTLAFAAGNSVALPALSQDIISFMYQLSQVSWHDNPLNMHISNGRKLEHYEIVVGDEESVPTHMGMLRAIPFRKVHGPNEDGLDIWLAVEYRLLPVKITQTDGKGNVTAEMVVSEIRVSDE